MGKKQIDLNAPLLSVRRFSSPSRSSEGVNKNLTVKAPPNRQYSLPVHKSDCEYAEVTKPAAVPFHWEQIPGRPKGEEGPVHAPEEISSTPKLPPGRVSGPIRYSGESPKLLSGRVSGRSRYNSGERSNDPSLNRVQMEAVSFYDHASLLEKLNESLNSRDDTETDSEDDAYSDALDKLSPTESWSLYSVSGLSGYQGSGMKSSETCSVDVQTRDFMMSRFLPAAKAVVLETPQYVVKKQPAVVEQPKPVKKVGSGELPRKPLLKHYSSDLLSRYIKYAVNAESEDDDKECAVPVKKSGKVWGILPRFCVKNSLCLLNPLPGMKSKNHAPKSPAADIRRLTRNAHSGPLDKNVHHGTYKKKFHSGVLSRELLEYGNKQNDSNQFPYSINSYKPGVSPLRQCRSGPISPYRNEAPKSPFHEGAVFLGLPKDIENHNTNKIGSSRKMFKALQDISRNHMHKQGSDSPGDAVEKTVYMDGVTSTDSLKAEKIIDISSKNLKSKAEGRKTEETQPVKSSDQDLSFLNVYDEGKSSIPRLSKSHPVSPHRNEVLKSSFHGYNAKQIASSRKLCKALQNVSRNNVHKKVLSPPTAVEKTVYIDTVTDSNCPKMDQPVDSSDKNLKSSGDSGQTEEKGTLKSSDLDSSSCQDILVAGKSWSPKLSRSNDRMDNFKLNPSLDQEPRSTIECSKALLDAKFEVNSKQNVEDDDQRDADFASLKSPLPPPLPKSPSESWLWRTLPSISLPNPFSNSSPFHPKKKAQDGIANDITWETMVKSSNSRNEHVRHSEELIPHVTHLHNKI